MPLQFSKCFSYPVSGSFAFLDKMIIAGRIEAFGWGPSSLGLKCGLSGSTGGNVGDLVFRGPSRNGLPSKAKRNIFRNFVDATGISCRASMTKLAPIIF